MPMLITILVKTPLWVWFVLAALTWLGLSRTRTRETSPILLLIPPMIFGGLVIVKLILSGFALTAVTGTISGIVLGVLAVLWLKPARNAQRLLSGRIRVEGEWTSLAAIMLVFGVNYAAAVASNIAPLSIAESEIQFAIALVNGLSAALISARTFAYLRVPQIRTQV